MVQVTAESPLIDVKQNAAAATINAEVIERIPKARDFTDLIRTAPGTQQERKSGIQIDGAGGSEHRYVIDGMDTTGIRTGVSGQEMPTDFVQEVQVKSSGYNAEFRATTGGVISAITKTGQQRLARQRRLLLPQQQLQRQTAPVAAADPADQPKAEYIITPDDEFERLEPTFELGGPDLARPRVVLSSGSARISSARARTVTFRTEPARRRHVRAERRGLQRASATSRRSSTGACG